MTLTTTIAILDPTPVAPLFRFCQSLIGDPDSMVWEHVPDDGTGDGVYRNRAGQGLPTLLWLRYGLDGPRRREIDEDDPMAEPDHVIAVSVDNPYGDEEGPNKQAWFVRELGRHLDDLGCRWVWKEEYAGVWYGGLYGLERLGNPERWTP